MEQMKIYQGKFERGERECDIWTGAREAALYLARLRIKRESLERKIERVELAVAIILSILVVVNIAINIK